jgi:hypothetical protein
VASASKGFHDVYLDTFGNDNKKTTSIVSTTMCNIGWQFRVSSIYIIYQHSIQLQIGISRIGTDLWLRLATEGIYSMLQYLFQIFHGTGFYLSFTRLESCEMKRWHAPQQRKMVILQWLSGARKVSVKWFKGAPLSFGQMYVRQGRGKRTFESVKIGKKRMKLQSITVVILPWCVISR